MAFDVKSPVSLRNVVKLTKTLHCIGPRHCIISTQSDSIPYAFVSKSKELLFQFSLSDSYNKFSFPVLQVAGFEVHERIHKTLKAVKLSSQSQILRKHHDEVKHLFL
jgi:hypothetical protein